MSSQLVHLLLGTFFDSFDLELCESLIKEVTASSSLFNRAEMARLASRQVIKRAAKLRHRGRREARDGQVLLWSSYGQFKEGSISECGKRHLSFLILFCGSFLCSTTTKLMTCHD